jgi:acyl-coenzyme A synthetase/AMP-(fatty) acid ligase
VERENEIFNIAIVVDKAACQWSDRVVLYHYESAETVTYKEVADMSNRVGNALRALGIEIENRVAILMDDCPEWVYVLFGGLKIGAVIIPFNTLLTEKDYAFFLRDSRAKVLFVGASHFDKVKGIISSLPYLRQVIVCQGTDFQKTGGRVVTWESFIQGAAGDLEIEPTVSGDLAFFIFTSGSTGRPRAIMHPHRNIAKPLFSIPEIYGIKEGDVQFHIPKLYFLTTLGGLVSAFHNGSAVVLLSGRPTPLVVLEIIARYRPTFLNGPPTIFARMVEAAREAPHLADLSSVRYTYCSGEALSPELFKSFQETFRKPLYNCWGMQELACAPLSWRYGEEVPLKKVGSVGRTPIPGAEIKIVDEHGNEVPDGVAGEIMLRVSGTVEREFLGYWHESRESARRFSEGWYKPGDSFMRDPDGYYWYLGRLDDLIKVGGRQIFTVEVEQVVARHPAVLEDAVIPVKNEYGLTELHVFVILKEGYSPSPGLAEQIQGFVKGELAPYKRPHHVEFVSELPKTATGKIQRFRLREQAFGREVREKNQ